MHQYMHDGGLGRLLLVVTRFPVAVLRIARTEGKNGVGQGIAELAPRADAHQQGAVAAAFDTPLVKIEQFPRMFHRCPIVSELAAQF